jgi:hypothetical protein
MWRYLSVAGSVVAAVSLAGCDIDAGNGNVTANTGSAQTINGTVHVPAGQHSGSVGAVNGSITLDENASVTSARIVNGSIDMGAHSTAESASSVNGPVTLGPGAHVAQGVTAINGEIDLKSGAEVGGTVKTVNGKISLSGAHVAGGLHTVDADIDIAGDSHVEGGILVEKASGWFSTHAGKPRIVIGPGAVVQGDLRFEHEVRLYVSDKATVGPITGATPITFSGEVPPG